MMFGTRVAFKSVVAARAAALIAWAALDNNDRVGGLVFCGDQHRELRPTAETTGCFTVMSDLERRPPWLT